MDWWRQAGPRDWREVLRRVPRESDEDAARHDSVFNLRACTYAERPFRDAEFVEEMAVRFGRQWNRGRPTRWAALTQEERAMQLPLFGAREKSGRRV